MKILTSERLRLRPVTKRDFSAIAELDSDPSVMRYLCLKSPVPSYEQALEEVHSILDLVLLLAGVRGQSPAEPRRHFLVGSGLFFSVTCRISISVIGWRRSFGGMDTRLRPADRLPITRF